MLSLPLKARFVVLGGRGAPYRVKRLRGSAAGAPKRLNFIDVSANSVIGSLEAECVVRPSVSLASPLIAQPLLCMGNGPSST